MYVHKDYLGTNPQTCKTSPIYGKSGLTCPGGILRKKYALNFPPERHFLPSTSDVEGR